MPTPNDLAPADGSARIVFVNGQAIRDKTVPFGLVAYPRIGTHGIEVVAQGDERQLATLVASIIRWAIARGMWDRVDALLGDNTDSPIALIDYFTPPPDRGAGGG